MIKLKNTTPKQLAEMHEKHKKQVEEKKHELNIRKNMKIRYIIDKKKAFGKKYYALVLVDELVITDTWKTAEELIQNSEKLGYKPKFKGFLQLNDAINFVRS